MYVHTSFKTWTGICIICIIRCQVDAAAILSSPTDIPISYLPIHTYFSHIIFMEIVILNMKTHILNIHSWVGILFYIKVISHTSEQNSTCSMHLLKIRGESASCNYWKGQRHPAASEGWMTRAWPAYIASRRWIVYGIRYPLLNGQWSTIWVIAKKKTVVEVSKLASVNAEVRMLQRRARKAGISSGY